MRETATDWHDGQITLGRHAFCATLPLVTPGRGAMDLDVLSTPGRLISLAARGFARLSEARLKPLGYPKTEFELVPKNSRNCRAELYFQFTIRVGKCLASCRR